MDFYKFQVLLLLGVVTITTGLDSNQFSENLQYEFTHPDPNSYFYKYENSDGQTKEEKGERTASSDFVVRGSYSYIGPDGVHYTVTYVADADGFHPTGNHINVPPYTPWPVNRILDDDADDGRYKPDEKYVPSNEKTPAHTSSNIIGSPTFTDAQKLNLPVTSHRPVPSATPQPPLPSGTHAYVQATPSVEVQSHSDRHEMGGVRAGAYPNDGIPSSHGNNLANLSDSVKISYLPAMAYIPSSPTPSVR